MPGSAAGPQSIQHQDTETIAMPEIPTYAYAFILALVAAGAGRVLGGKAKDDPGSMPLWILYAVAAGCVVIGLAIMWLDNRA
jgi:hypothetical protein